MRAPPRPDASAPRRSAAAHAVRIRRGGWVAALLVVLALIPAADSALPQNPLPLAIELHPPFRGKCWGLAMSSDGVLAAGSIGCVALYDGLHWRYLTVSNIDASRALVLTSDKVWIGGRAKIGWILRHSTDTQFHPVVTDIPGEVFYLTESGHNILGASFDTVVLIAPDGRVLDRVTLPKPARRFLYPWADGWLFTGTTDAYFIRATDRLSISNRTPVANESISAAAAVASFRVDDRTYFVGGRRTFFLNDGKLDPVDRPDWSNLSAEHLMTVFRSTEPDSPVFRLSLDGGLKAFEPHTLAPLWQLRPGEDIAGTPSCLPVVSKQGIFLGTDTCVYWLPSVSGARLLTTGRQQVQAVGAGRDGFWISTSEGSWFDPINSWSATAARPASTSSVAELPLGVVRGLFRSLDVNGRVVPLESAGAQTMGIEATNEGFALNQAGRLSRWTSRLEKIDAVDLMDGLTTMVAAPDSTLYAGTMLSGVVKWPPHQGVQTMRRRGNLRSEVAWHGRELMVLWGDGLLEIGSDRVQLPSPDERDWSTLLSLDERTVIVGGEFAGGGAIMLVERQDGRWNLRPLEHPLLDTMSHVDALAKSGDWIGIAGPGGSVAVQRSVFPPVTAAIDPTPARLDAAMPANGHVEHRRVTPENDEIRLQPGENEIRFGIRGGTPYWTQRVRFFYRLLPGSGEWTPLDLREKAVLQRIDTGAHVLEVQSRSVVGTSLSRLTILRPPFWYVSDWALASYALLGIGLVVGGSFWRIRRLALRARRLEERVAERTDELRKANEAKNEFLASMSHEIRNPLNGVIGLSAMLRESARNERERRLTDALRACADQLRLVLDDILDFSVIERGEIRVQSEIFDAASAIRAAVLATDPRRERTVLTIASEAEHGFIRGDEGKVRQIVTNLVSNALKFGVPPEAQVEVTLQGERLTVVVRNTGPDIPADDLTRIFVAFERGRSAAHQYVRGTGLGLTVSSRLARAMGGDITATSANGETTFTFSVPVVAAEAPPSSARRSAPVRMGSVLAIEDEAYNRLVLGHVLNGFGCSVDWAQSGREALDILASSRGYDVIFTDWMLPDIKGDELVRRIRQACGAATPTIIAITAYATADKRAEALAAGVSAFVTKPITAEKIDLALGAERASSIQTTARRSDLAPLRLGILTEDPNPAARLQDYRTQLLSGAAELSEGLRDRDSARTMHVAHRIASQLLAIHHEALADAYRDIESHASRGEWTKIVELHAAVAAETAQVARRLSEVAEQLTSNPA